MRKYIYGISLVLLMLNSCQDAGKEYSTPMDAIIQTEYGKVRGYVHKGIYTYKGIPYAQAERFMPPEAPKLWNGIRSAFSYGPVCPQNDPHVIDQSEFFFNHDFGYPGEDCFLLNIWSPNVNDNIKRPVMVWLHGGGFATGSGNELPSYDGENLSRKGDIIVVNLNHRLNVLGFLNLSSFGNQFRYTGNLGMLDLIAALNWVKTNINQFGGDPNNITIFGQSGGGRKVCALLTMPSAQGLFHKAIIQSGASLEYYANEESQKIGEMVVHELGLDAQHLDSIKKMPYELLRSAGERVLQKLNKQYLLEGKTLDGFHLRWSPSTDGDLIPYQPSDERANLLMKDVPIMIGSTKNEFVSAFDSPIFINPKTQEEARNILSLKYKSLTDSIIKAIEEAYPKDNRPVDLLDVDTRGRLSTIQLANLKSKESNVFNYLFTWESPILEGRFRSCHCLDLPFVFDNIDRCLEMTGGGIEAYTLADKMSQAWINFARSGNPNHSKIPKWEPYTQGNEACMIFDRNCKVVYHHDQKLLELVTQK